MNTSFGSGSSFTAGRAAFGAGASNSPQFKAANQKPHTVKFGFNAVFDDESAKTKKTHRGPIEWVKDQFKKD